MSDDGGLPMTTARAIVLATIVGTFALAGHEPRVAVGVLCGIVLAMVIRGFAGSHGRVVIASALFPVVVGAIMGIGIGTDSTDVVLPISGVIVGIAVGNISTGWPSETSLSRAATTALVSAGATGGVTLLAYLASITGDHRLSLATVPWLTGSGVVGVLGALVIAGLAVTVGVLAVPPAVFTTPRHRQRRIVHRNILVQGVLFATGFGVVVLAVGTLLAGPQIAFGRFVDGSVVRGLLTAATLVGISLIIVGTVIRYSWRSTEGRENAIVPILLGSVCGVGGSAVLVVLGVPGEAASVVVPLFGAMAVTFLVLGIATWWYVGVIGVYVSLSPATAVAGGLAVGGITVGVSGDVAATGTAAVRAGIPSLVALGAGLFVYDVGRYGRVLTRETGPDGVSRRPQLVRLGWNGVITGVGVPVALLGLWLATIAAPALSIPATGSVIVGLVAIVGGTALLLQ